MPSPTPEPVPFAEASRTLLRRTVLDAVGALVAERGWTSTTLTDVARRAGVSRQSLYNLFGSRESVAQAFVLREVDRFLDDVEAAIGGHRDDPVLALRAALGTFLTTAADNVVVTTIVTGGDGGGLLPYVTTQGGPVTHAARDRLSAVLLRTWPGSRDTDLVADVLVRLAISYAAQPDATAERTADDVTRLLAPFVRDALDI